VTASAGIGTDKGCTRGGLPTCTAGTTAFLAGLVPAQQCWNRQPGGAKNACTKHQYKQARSPSKFPEPHRSAIASQALQYA